ncbi:MAG TPA: phosphate signaling complex protein PhoU [Acidimicrobiia bacterium]|jgi:phosphate transport system protein
MTADHTGPVEHRIHDMPRHHFSETLDEIQQGLVHMGSVVLENVRRAGDAMVEGRLDLIQTVKDTDETVNQMYLDLERQTFETLARQQPVAGDLRFLVAATRMLYELERSGDLAVNCVKMLERLDGFPHHDRITSLMEQMVTASCKVFAKAVDALADLTPTAGVDLDNDDDEVDDLVSEFYAAVGRYSEDVGLDAAIGFSRVGRFVERIADHAVNIGENVTYIVTASFPGDVPAGE